MNRTINLILVLASCVLAGCGSVMRDSNIAGAREERARSTACCDSLSGIPFVTRKLGEEFEVVINRESPTFSFAEGKSFVSGIALPVVPPAALSLIFRTFISSGYLPGATVLIPKIACLDSNFALISIQSSEGLRRGEEFLAGTYFEGFVQLAAGTKYVILLSDETDAKPVTAFSSNGTPHSIPRAPIGRLTVQVKYFATGHTTRIRYAGEVGV